MASIDEVYAIVKETAGKVNELVEWKAGLSERCEAHREKTEELRDVVFGNPGGLRSKVEKLWNCKNGITRWRDFWMYVLKIIVAAGALGLIAWLLQSIFGDN